LARGRFVDDGRKERFKHDGKKKNNVASCSDVEHDRKKGKSVGRRLKERESQKPLTRK